MIARSLPVYGCNATRLLPKGAARSGDWARAMARGGVDCDEVWDFKFGLGGFEYCSVVPSVLFLKKSNALYSACIGMQDYLAGGSKPWQDEVRFVIWSEMVDGT